jgi:hypothetical protein
VRPWTSHRDTVRDGDTEIEGADSLWRFDRTIEERLLCIPDMIVNDKRLRGPKRACTHVARALWMAQDSTATLRLRLVAWTLRCGNDPN